MDLNLALPAYEMVLKAGHTFNLLDAHGAIFFTQSARITLPRIRTISAVLRRATYDSRERLGFRCLRSLKSVETQRDGKIK